MHNPRTWILNLGGCLLSLATSSAWAFGEARGIDGFRVLDAARYQVFSERGIGAFNLIAQSNTLHNVCFFYSTEKPFKRLEGITITQTTADGDRKLTEFNVQNGCVEFEFREKENLPVQIEFVDMHR